MNGAAWLGGIAAAGLLAVTVHLAMSNHARTQPLPIVDVGPPFIEFFERVVSPALLAADILVRATYVSETRPNNFPRPPIRENERAFVWFSGHRDAQGYAQSLARLRQSAEWARVREHLRSVLIRDPEVHRLEPTPRSALAD